MLRRRECLSDAEITRRARVNPQYLQRHRDLKAKAEAVRAHLATDHPRAEAAATAGREAALTVENRMLLAQNATLRRDLETMRAELRAIRARDLAANARGDLASHPTRDAEIEALRRERDEALAAVRSGEADLLAQRNVVQRLIAENTRLLGSAAPSEHGPGFGAVVLQDRRHSGEPGAHQSLSNTGRFT
ncbi:hypothetical protein ACFY84_25435 [Streptomyces sp. NPDC012438]|uniref:hypothetical protein n=1 Tax=Streptomyces sp. NPDC012438 TaxID=3364833 RepID=UPI0036E8B4E3